MPAVYAPSDAKFRLWFLGVVAVAFAIKAWLTAIIRILPIFAPADASNYLVHAAYIARGLWFGPYDNMTLIKQPFFPIYLAMVQDSGISLTVAHLLLDALAAALAVLAIRPLIRSRVAAAAIFLVIYFNPFSYDMMAWLTYRTQVNSALALLSVACAAAIFVRRRRPIRESLPWAIGLGFSFAAFWLNREESIWLLPCEVAILGAYLLAVWKRHDGTLVRRALLLGVPVGIVVATIAAIMVVNGRQYGWYTTNEEQSREFVSAYTSLSRVVGPQEPFIPVPRAARMLAYSVSPAANELRPALEGANGAAWAKITCDDIPSTCPQNDIAAGWFLWALRDAAQAAGHYTSGRDARRFWVELASEMDAACDAGKIPCRRKPATMFPLGGPGDIPVIAEHFWTGLLMLLSCEPLSFDPWNAPPPSVALRTDYDFIARNVDDGVAPRTFKGWLAHRSLRDIAVIGPGSDGATITFAPSPDVQQVLSRDKRFASGWESSLARFEIKSECTTACSLALTNDDGSTSVIPLSTSTAGGFLYDKNFVYHSDGSECVTDVAFDAHQKMALLRELGKLYQALFGAAVVLSVVLFGYRLVRSVALRRPRLPDHDVLLLASASSVLFLILALAMIDAFSFTSFNAEYMAAMFPLALFAAAMTLSIEGPIAYRILRRHLPSLEEGRRTKSAN